MSSSLSVTLSRRALLASAVSSGLGGAAAAADSGGWIDAHVHVWTPDTARYPLAEGFTLQDMAPPSFTPEELFAHAKPEGVTRIVLIQMSFYRFDNRYLLDVMEAWPGVFGGVAIVDDQAPDVVEKMRELGARGVRGFRLYASRANVAAWGGSAGMKAMWAHAAASGQAMCLLSDPDALPGIGEQIARFPETTVVIDHFSRIGMRGPADPADLDRLCALAEFPKVHVKTSAFYALGEKRPPYLDLIPAIRRLRDAYGAGRLMWASDCPYQVGEGHTYRESIALVRDRLGFLSAAERNEILRGTAERLFF
jgi:predicted TIM-barrel fold metal-dependent hydrolase